MSWSFGVKVTDGVTEVVSRTDHLPDGLFTVSGHENATGTSISTGVYLYKEAK